MVGVQYIATGNRAVGQCECIRYTLFGSVKIYVAEVTKAMLKANCKSLNHVAMIDESAYQKYTLDLRVATSPLNLCRMRFFYFLQKKYWLKK